MKGLGLQSTGSNQPAITVSQVAAECRRAVSEYCANLELDLATSNNLGNFYKYANRKLSSQTGIGVIKTASGVFVSDPVGQANAFIEFFAASFVNDNNNMPRFNSRLAPGVGNASVEFAEGVVFKKLTKL